MGHRYEPIPRKGDKYEKAWGYELWIVNHDAYCGKLLVFNNAGDHFSMHYHMIKNETWYIQEGAFQFDWIDGEKAERCYTQLQKGDIVRGVIVRKKKIN